MKQLRGLVGTSLLMLGLVVPTAFGQTGAGAPEPSRCEWAFWYQDEATQWDGFLMLWNPMMETQNLEVSIVTASQVLKTPISLTANESILLNSEGIKGKKQFGALRVV